MVVNTQSTDPFCVKQYYLMGYYGLHTTDQFRQGYRDDRVCLHPFRC